jgi:hypothetical protein
MQTERSPVARRLASRRFATVVVLHVADGAPDAVVSDSQPGGAPWLDAQRLHVRELDRRQVPRKRVRLAVRDVEVHRDAVGFRARKIPRTHDVGLAVHTEVPRQVTEVPTVVTIAQFEAKQEQPAAVSDPVADCRDLVFVDPVAPGIGVDETREWGEGWRHDVFGPGESSKAPRTVETCRGVRWQRKHRPRPRLPPILAVR